MAAEKVGLKIMADYNYALNDVFHGKVYGESDDPYCYILIGVNFYIGGHRKKENNLKGSSNIINSNLIINEN